MKSLITDKDREDSMKELLKVKLGPTWRDHLRESYLIRDDGEILETVRVVIATGVATVCSTGKQYLYLERAKRAVEKSMAMGAK